MGEQKTEGTVNSAPQETQGKTDLKALYNTWLPRAQAVIFAISLIAVLWVYFQLRDMQAEAYNQCVYTIYSHICELHPNDIACTKDQVCMQFPVSKLCANAVQINTSSSNILLNFTARGG